METYPFPLCKQQIGYFKERRKCLFSHLKLQVHVNKNQAPLSLDTFPQSREEADGHFPGGNFYRTGVQTENEPPYAASFHLSPAIQRESGGKSDYVRANESDTF